MNHTAERQGAMAHMLFIFRQLRSTTKIRFALGLRRMNDVAGWQDMGFSRRRPLTDSGAFVGGVGRSRSEGGVFSTAKALRLEYCNLKQLLTAAAKV